ncbi:MAG: hypothetical protein ACD_28C00370G0002 [uncultured bacterium]|nr:MAG: hypothetical protein ACD_28C00370G0002 [uncultured bacterium]
MSLSKENIQDRVFYIISQVCKVPLEEIGEDTSPQTLSEWDSISHLNLILVLEEEFGLKFSDEQIVEMLSVRAMIPVIRGKISRDGS